MITKILIICNFFFEMLISAIFFSGITQRKKKLTAVIISGALIFGVGAVINIFIINTFLLNAIFSIAANLLFSMAFFKIKLSQAGFYSVLLVSVSSILEHIVTFIILSFSKQYIADYETNAIVLTAETIISKALFFIIAMLLLHLFQKDKATLKFPLSFYIFPLITLISVLCSWYLCLNRYSEFTEQIILGVINIFLLIATLFVFFSFQTKTQKEHRLILLQQEYNKILTDMNYYEILEKQNENLRIYAHDIKNHLSAIKNLNDNPEIEKYISDMTARLTEYGKVCHSGNHTLDVVIDKYVTECEINNIRFEFDVINNNLSQIEPFDLVAILGNLLDNALEASVQSQNKAISLATDYRNNFSVIVVANSCDNFDYSGNSEFPETTKSNKRIHGIGLNSVKSAAKKYNGDLDWQYHKDKKEFVVVVMLSKKSEPIYFDKNRQAGQKRFCFFSGDS